ncbi:hypothetical protein, partial [uncultured Subdoligranulum sp.]|uniref:hypothetical protein n=1 Tax=uncultured Subdoligranulum sp. TaxID=512298 RepID=UPI0025F1D55B
HAYPSRVQSGFIIVRRAGTAQVGTGQLFGDSLGAPEPEAERARGETSKKLSYFTKFEHTQNIPK